MQIFLFVCPYALMPEFIGIKGIGRIISRGGGGSTKKRPKNSTIKPTAT